MSISEISSFRKVFKPLNLRFGGDFYYKNMNKQSTIKQYIESVLKTSSFAVLATEGNGQPHTSLIAITPVENYRQIIFATYRNTLKYRNLSDNNKVAVLIEGEHFNMEGQKESVVLTIIGHTEEIIMTGNEAPYQVHLNRHRINLRSQYH